ncbi:MAG TPA: hypothetical protein VGK96_28260, partial [Candidatus Sulfotelmatobacter sp.]
MAIGDILSTIGSGLEKGVKAAGTIAVPVLQRTAEVVSGEAPQIDAEKRAQAYKLEDAGIASKAQELESQLEIGRKYGTLTPEQQQQYVDQITGLYSHPRHAPQLMEKLRQVIHPNGATAGNAPPMKPLPNAVPPGGTGAADEAQKEKQAELKQQAMLAAIDARAAAQAKYHKPAGKSPPLPGNALPPEAIGPDGQPIPQDARNAGNSFVEWNGSFWPVAKAKPVLKKVAGHLVLVDPSTGAKLRDVGPIDTGKVTTRQQLQPGDDGQMHMVTLTTVSTPQGEKIDVTPESEAQTDGGEAAKPPTSAQPVGKSSVGGIVKPKPVTQPPGGAPKDKTVVPGLSSLANHKLQSNADKQTLESSKQIISSVNDVLPLLEPLKNNGSLEDAVKMRLEFAKYKRGIPPSDPNLTKIFENTALMSVLGASLWTKIGRSR